MAKKAPYIVIAFSIAGMLSILSYFDAYDYIENLLLDLRFKSRGRMETRSDIATVDIDVPALQKEGKWDPWSREKHIPLIKAAGEHGMDALIFDFYFIEDSERKLEMKELNKVTDSAMHVDDFKRLFPDPDNDLALASKKSGNIIFGQSFKPQGKKREPVKKATPTMARRLKLLEKRDMFKVVDPEDFPTLFSAYDIEAPVDTLIQSSLGIYFFQSDPDIDGLQRKFPLVMLYGDKLFPAASLAIALRHYGVSFDDVEINPGKFLKFNLPEPDEHGREEILIPINEKGQMQVNWAGEWEDKQTNEFDVMHYPYNVVKNFQRLEYPNYVLAEYKRIAYENFDGEIYSPELLKSVVKTMPGDRKQIIDVAKKLYPLSIAEKYIRKNPDKTAADFKKLPPFMYNPLRNNNIIANAFKVNGYANLDSLMLSGAISFKTGIQNYQFSTLEKLQTDLINEIKITKNEKDKKNLKKIEAQLIALDRDFNIVSNLYRLGLINQQRPLFFYGNSRVQRAGKGPNRRMIVPFEFVGKKLYYGLTATGTSDLNPMPFEARYPMVGLHANALNTILDNKIITEISKQSVIVIIIGIAIFLSFGVSSLSAAIGGVAIFSLVGIYAYTCFWLFENRYVWLDMFGPLVTMIFGYLGITIYNYIQEEKNKEFLKESFGTYVSPELIDQMYESGEEPSLGGEEGYHTAFFTDIQSFSAFSEKLTASELVTLLNQYLTDMTNVLLENNGTLDKYIGDAIVAFYGAPIEVENHELQACKTAIKMQENLEVLRQGWQEEGDRWPEIVHHMQNRIGISSGQMVTGNMGSESRMNYTMMGDNVNTAARLESSAKQYGIYIQIAASTYEPIKDQVVVRDLDYVRVMGKEEPVKVYELISEVGQEPDVYKKILPAYEEALKLYKAQEWVKAIEAFKASDELEDMFPGRKTNPSRIYIPRCEHFLSNSPGDDWDGVWTLTSK